MPSFIRSVAVITLFCILAVPFGIFEIALAANFPAYSRWRLTWRNFMSTTWYWIMGSRYSIPIHILVWILNPVVAVILILVNYGQLLYLALAKYLRKGAIPGVLQTNGETGYIPVDKEALQAAMNQEKMRRRHARMTPFYVAGSAPSDAGGEYHDPYTVAVPNLMNPLGAEPLVAPLVRATVTEEKE